MTETKREASGLAPVDVPGADAPAGDGERLELRFSLCDVARRTDVRVLASSAHTVEELARSLSEHLGIRTSSSLWCRRRALELAPQLTLDAAEILWGDELLLSGDSLERMRVGDRPLLEMLVTGGPCAGQRFVLGEGTYSVGRGEDAAIQILDPSLSRRHLDLTVAGGGVTIVDLGSRNGTAVRGIALAKGEARQLHPTDEIELGRTLVRIEPISMRSAPELSVRAGRIAFNRPPRVAPGGTAFASRLSAPPGRGRKARIPLAAAVVPLLAGLLLFLFLRSPAMLAVAALSPVMALTTFLGDHRGGRRSFAKQAHDFQAELTRILDDLDRALEMEAEARRLQAPDATALRERLSTLAPSLWERRAEHPDFLGLRVGVADLPALSEVCFEPGGDVELRAHAETELVNRRRLPAVPLALDVRTAAIVGMAGARGSVEGLARWLVLQAAILHSPADLVVVAALGHDRAADWSWLKWLPHLRPQRIGLARSAVAVGRDDASDLLQALRGLRAPGQRRDQSGGEGTLPHVLVVVDEQLELDRALVSAAFAEAASRGISALWLGTTVRDLPGQATILLELDDRRSVLTATDAAAGTVEEDVSAEALDRGLAEEMARRLAPLRDVSEAAREGDIPQRVALLELIGLSPPTSDSIERRWLHWDGNLRVTVGACADGPITIDLRDEGPHALIAGTTGSGKSELLRTFVAAAAAAVPPHRLTFLLVDYKGGAAFAPCGALPHVLDTISDLDDHLAERALISLRAELTRRSSILAQWGAKDLQELERRAPDAAPPLLVIAVDEFAKLRDEVPQFVDGVVDIAQRGRSMGVHMVLAAQTLRNSFTGAMRANTNIRVALRVAEESESEDVIASPLAARIPSGSEHRGRAFVRTGKSELREFQTAYVSGLSETASRADIEIGQLDLTAPRAAPEWPSGDDDADSDLVRLAHAAGAARAGMQLPIPPPPWQPVLRERIAFEDLGELDLPAAVVAVGVVDRPHEQRQVPLLLDFPSNGNVVVFGAGNSGKSTALASTGVALSRAPAATDIAIYGIDAGGGALKALEAIPRCGAVVAVEDEERVQRLLHLLARRTERRDRASHSPGLTFLLIDDLESFSQQYNRPGTTAIYDQLLRIAAGGRSAGVHLMVSATRRAALPAALAAHFGQRLVLRMTTEDDMLALGVDARAVRGARLPPGRGFTHESHEFQLVECPPLSVGQLDARYAGAIPPAPIEVLATRVPRTSLPRAEGLRQVPIGLADLSREPAFVDLSEMHFLVVGPYRSGRSTTLETLALGLTAMPNLELHLLSPRRSPLRDCDIWTTAAIGSSDCAASVQSLLARVEAGQFDTASTVLFIDDAGEIAEAAVGAQLERLVRLGRDTGLRIVASVESGAARGLGAPWVRELRREGHGLLLQPDLLTDGDLLGTRLPRKLPAPLVAGRGFLVFGGVSELVQVAT